MARRKIQLSDVVKKDLKILGYLLVSGFLGFALARYVVGSEELTALFAPAINFVLYRLEKELKEEGYVKVLK